ETLEPLKRRLGLDLSVVVRNDKHRVAVEVGTRQALCHRMVDSHCVRCVAEELLRLRVAIVHHEFGDLEETTVREPNKRYAVTIVEGGCVDLARTHGVDRQDHLGGLSRKVCCLEVNGRGVC